MPAANIAVLYWTASTIMWGKVSADTDAEITALQAFYASDPNTSVLLIPRVQPFDDASCKAAITLASGKATRDDTCAVVDALNNVVSVIKADPAMNAAPAGHALVTCPPGTVVGATHNPLTKIFTNPIVAAVLKTRGA